MYKAFFFDMDGVLFNSMPRHAKAWEEVMQRHGLRFTVRDTYVNEGRTGHSVIDECYLATYGTEAPDGLWQLIYEEKSRAFERQGEPEAIDGVREVLDYLCSLEPKVQIWIVTGSAQHSLFDRLERFFPSVFSSERMITADDVTHGKPDPEPYLKAWERSSLSKDECCVVENAPLGVRSAKSAGLTCLAVNTGILLPQDLEEEHADKVFDNMHQLLQWLRQLN